nr:cytochrome P450 [Streptomyces clavuligerus]
MSASTMPFPAPRGGCPFAPPPLYEAAREEEPLTRVTLFDGSEAWLATRHSAVRLVLSDPRFSADIHTPGFPLTSPRQRFMAQGEPSFVRMDAPEHTRQRRMLTSWFTARRVRAMRPAVQALVDERIDRIEPRGQADLFSEFALPVPSLVICDILGVPYEDHEFFEGTSRAMAQWNTTPEESSRCWNALHTYLSELAAAKRECPDERLVSHLAARDDLTLAQVASMCRLLLVAGHDTTASAIGLSVAALLANPEWAAALRDSPGHSPEAVDELLRLVSPLGHHGIGRAALADVEVDGRTVRAGEGVLVIPPTANRDGRAFDRVDAFLVAGERDQSTHHLSFGHGPHLCLGAPLARLEMEIALETLFRRLPGLRLARPLEELPFRGPGAIHGLDALPVRW